MIHIMVIGLIRGQRGLLQHGHWHFLGISVLCLPVMRIRGTGYTASSRVRTAVNRQIIVTEIIEEIYPYAGAWGIFLGRGGYQQK